MDFKLTFIPDKEYYKTAYTEIISTLKLKKYEPIFAVIMILLGIILYFQDGYKVTGIFPIFFALVGLYELFKVYYERKKWLADRLNSKIEGQQIELEFTEEGIIHSGPFSNGFIKWNGIQSIHKTAKGILLKPANGLSIYLPDNLFKDKNQIQFILSKQN